MSDEESDGVPLQSERYKTCDSCGAEIEMWRRPHSHLCSDCGMPRCRGCGISVEGMSNTMNGGLCVPCSVDEYGHPA